MSFDKTVEDGTSMATAPLKEIFQEVDLMQTADAYKWAKEFMRIFGKRKQDIDEGLMLTWFASAIMCGYDESGRRNYTLEHTRKPTDAIAESRHAGKLGEKP